MNIACTVIPAFAILHASGQLPVGHACKVRHTYTLTVLAVDEVTKSAAVLWQQDRLPSDSVCLVSLSHRKFAGSVCVVSLNALLVASHDGVVGIAVNGFADTTVSPHHDLQPWENRDESLGGLELDASRWNEEGRSTQSQVLIGVLKGGLVLRVDITLVCPDHFSLSNLMFVAEVIATTSPHCSSFSVGGADRDIWFLGSRQGDSLLVAVERLSKGTIALSRPAIDFDFKQEIVASNSSSNSRGSLSPSKRRRRFTNSFIDAEDFCRSSEVADDEDARRSQQLDAQEEEENLLYGVTLDSSAGGTHATVESFTYALSVVDTIAVVGPVLDGMFCRPDAKFARSTEIDWDHRTNKRVNAANGSSQMISAVTSTSAASYISERESKDTWQLSAGLDEGASLYRVYSGLSLSKIASRNFVGASNLFSVGIDSAVTPCSSYSLLVVSYAEPSRTRVFRCAESEAKATASGPAAPELRMKEVGLESGFTLSSSSLNVGILVPASTDFPSPIAVQILPQSVRVVSLPTTWNKTQESGSESQEILVGDEQSAGGLGCEAGEVVVSGQVCADGGWVVLLTNLCSLLLLQFDPSSRRLELRHERRFPGLSSLGPNVVESSAMDFGGEDDLQKSALELAVHSAVVSTSLYFGHLEIDHSAPKSKKPSVGPGDFAKSAADLLIEQLLQEETLLYGAPLGGEEDDSNVEGVTITEMKEDQSLGLLRREDAKENKQAFLVLTEVTGALSILRLADLKCVFKTHQVGKLASSIVCSEELSHLSAPFVLSADASTIVETRLARIGLAGSPFDTTSLCLEVDGTVYAWNKANLTCIHNTRRQHKAKLNLLRSVSTGWVDPAVVPDESELPPPALVSADSLGAEYVAYLCSAEGRLLKGEQVLGFVENLSGRSGVLVSANEPLIIAGDRGMPHVLSLGLPEIPYVNFGRYCALPLRAGSINAVATLWCDLEEPDYIRSLTGDVMRSGRTAVLGIYQEVVGLELYPNSSVSTKKIHVGKTVHRYSEVLRRTDDKTELALLEKRTFVMSCSETVTRPFIPTVLTAEEALGEDVLYERYLTSLDSFCQPNLALGDAPILTERSHSLSIVQGDAVMDTFVLPNNETVLDMQVLYLTLERVIVPATNFSSAIKTVERRVFVMASTSVADRRGEDSQGAGRLLLFTLDYALFQEDATAASETEGVEAVNGSSEQKESESAEEVAASATKSKDDVPIASKITGAAHSAATAKFLGAIRPKLKLTWSGPGPASVIRQMGEYVLSTVGSAVFVYKINAVSLEMEQVAFHFAQFYITSISVAKNYIMLADMFHSVQFLVWREADCSLTEVSKDYEDCTAISTTFVGDGHKLGMLMGDDEGNVQLLQQNPKKLESNKGTRLLCLADFHVGSDVSLLHAHELLSADMHKLPPMMMLDNRPPPPRTRKGSNFPLQPFGARFNKSSSVPSAIKMGAMLGTMDGGVGLMVPVDERMYRRLALLQQIMSITVQSPLALNPRDFRAFKSSRFRVNKKKGILDGSLLWSFCSLHPNMQEELAAAVGSTAYLIRENLHEI
eukprot:gene27975-34765_t